MPNVVGAPSDEVAPSITLHTQPRVRIITMGCAKNVVDSDRMRARLERAGFAVESTSLRDVGRVNGGVSGDVDVSGDGDGDRGDGCGDDRNRCRLHVPDVTIVNTCSFITKATQESLDAVFAVIDERDMTVSSESKIVVAGCMPSRYGDELEAEIPEVDAFLDVDGENDVVELVSELLGIEQIGRLGQFGQPGQPSDEAFQGQGSDALQGEPRGADRTAREPFAYLKISDGCDRFCSFCTIPYIRGRYTSRTAREIIAEARSLAAHGVRELVLIGQDTGIWGDDFSTRSEFDPLPRPTLAALMELLAQELPNVWIRVMYLQPQRTDDELLRVMARYDNICSYLDIPLQHCSAKVIREMNREGSGEEYLQLLEHVRGIVPGVTLRTTMIAGFPGETDEEADDMASFMREAAFDFAGVFEYSQEDGTVAGEREDQVDEAIAVERANAVREAIEECGTSSAAARVGNTYDVLVCGVVGVDDEFESSLDSGASNAVTGGECVNADGGTVGVETGVAVWGRAQFQAPEVDSVFYFDAPPNRVGTFAKVFVTGTLGYDLEGELRQ